MDQRSGERKIPELEMTYTTEQLAKRYSCTPMTVSRWVRTGRLAAINLGGERNGPYRFRREDIEAYEERCRVGRSGQGEARA